MWNTFALQLSRDVVTAEKDDDLERHRTLYIVLHQISRHNGYFEWTSRLPFLFFLLFYQIMK